MRIRPTAAVIVLDDRQRVLLFNVEDAFAVDIARPNLTTWWGPPGGGVEAGETYEEAGIRELWEETGISVAQLSPWIATYERRIKFPDVTVLFHIRYFAVEVPASEVDISNLLDDERAIIRAHRWWTVEEIEQSSADFLPPGLPGLLRTILYGEFPPQQLVLE